MASIAQQDVIHNSDIDRGDDAITILVTIDYSTRVIIEQVVVKRCHVNAAHNAVAVNIAKHAADGSSSRHIATGIIHVEPFIKYPIVEGFTQIFVTFPRILCKFVAGN